MELNKIPHKISYRKVKYPRLEFVTGILHIILPRGADPEAVYRRHEKWVKKKYDFIKECRSVGVPRGFIQRTMQDFMKSVCAHAAKSAQELNVKVKKIAFREMKTKWASCNSKGNISINTLMMNMPEELIDYVVFHEVAHLKQMRHNAKFWAIVAQRFPHYKALEKELSVYWFNIDF
ncbi:MAG: M48 family metallopeptidase [Candidatus Aminicenantes bacterium]|jgi:predicted metal-dependent hydrolase